MKKITIKTLQQAQTWIEIIWGATLGYLIIADSKLMTRTLYIFIGIYFCVMAIGGIIKLYLDWRNIKLQRQIETLKQIQKDFNTLEKSIRNVNNFIAKTAKNTKSEQ